MCSRDRITARTHMGKSNRDMSRGHVAATKSLHAHMKGYYKRLKRGYLLQTQKDKRNRASGQLSSRKRKLMVLLMMLVNEDAPVVVEMSLEPAVDVTPGRTGHLHSVGVHFKSHTFNRLCRIENCIKDSKNFPE